MSRTQEQLAEMGKVAEKCFKEMVEYLDCDGVFQERDDGCCVKEDMEFGCEWLDFCRLKNRELN